MPTVSLKTQTVEAEAKEFGNGAHIILPKKFIGQTFTLEVPRKPGGEPADYYEVLDDATNAQVGDWFVVATSFKDTGEVWEYEISNPGDLDLEGINGNDEAFIARERLYTGE